MLLSFNFLYFELLVGTTIGIKLVSVLSVTYYAARKDGRRLGHAVRERALNCAAVKTLMTALISSSTTYIDVFLLLYLSCIVSETEFLGVFCAVVPSVVDVTVTTPYDSQVTLKVCAMPPIFPSPARASINTQS
jgi:hypothetical protein